MRQTKSEFHRGSAHFFEGQKRSTFGIAPAFLKRKFGLLYAIA